jgi:hypothetical protein
MLPPGMTGRGTLTSGHTGRGMTLGLCAEDEAKPMHGGPGRERPGEPRRVPERAWAGRRIPLGDRVAWTRVKYRHNGTGAGSRSHDRGRGRERATDLVESLILAQDQRWRRA